MTASVVVASGGYLVWRGRRQPRLLWLAALALLLSSAPLWTRAWLEGRRATQVVSLAGRGETMLGHLGAVLPHLHEPLGGLLGTHVPLVPDAPESVLYAPGWIAFGLILVYGVSLIQAVRSARAKPTAWLYFAVVVLALAAFPFPLRSSPSSLRFLSLVPAAESVKAPG